MDFENLLIELLSTEVNEKFTKRALEYVSLTNIKKENDKIVNLMVLSTADRQKPLNINFLMTVCSDSL